MRGSRFVGVVGRSTPAGCAVFDLDSDFTGSVPTGDVVDANSWVLVEGATAGVSENSDGFGFVCTLVAGASYDVTVAPVGWSTDDGGIDLSTVDAGGSPYADWFTVWDTGGVQTLTGTVVVDPGVPVYLAFRVSPVTAANIEMGAGSRVTVCPA